MFTEIGLLPHFYLFIAGAIVLLLYLGYVFWYDHKNEVTDKDLHELFKKYGLTDTQIADIKHDDDVWYYKNKSTCIGYSSDPREACPKFQWVCLGDRTFGNLKEQIYAISQLIKNGMDSHPDCPLIYEGAS
ncbi:MAG TPA: hypothetical protein PKD85_00585 [Saprospiraceae bacterium]|nr:hypothetical protein [Saprospiraceae bacterium]